MPKAPQFCHDKKMNQPSILVAPRLAVTDATYTSAARMTATPKVDHATDAHHISAYLHVACCMLHVASCMLHVACRGEHRAKPAVATPRTFYFYFIYVLCTSRHSIRASSQASSTATPRTTIRRSSRTCCMPHAACRMSYFACCMFVTYCRESRANRRRAAALCSVPTKWHTCCMLHVACCVCCMLHVACRMLHVACGRPPS